MRNGGESGEHMAGSGQGSSLWDGYGSDEFVPEEEGPEDIDWGNPRLGQLPRGLPLVRLCLSNVLKDLEIVAFQALSISLSLAFLGIYITWVFPTQDWETIAMILSNPLGILVLYPYFVSAILIVTYFNVASVGVATMRLQGKSPTIRDGLRIANSRLWSIIGWALFNASIAIFFAMLKRSKKPGARLAGSLGELGWAAAVYFVVPIMIFKRLGPIDAVHESTHLVKRTWKNALVGNFGMGGVFLLLALPSLLILAIFNGLGIFWVGIGFFIGYLLALGVFSNAAHSVLLSALYLMATGGRTKDFAAYPDVKDVLATMDSRTHGQDASDRQERAYSLLKYTRR
jgi:hypothetical protein